MKIGLLGFGVVGKGFYDLTATRDDMQVAKVVCLEDVTLPDAEVTRDIQSILTDDTIDTVIEAMGGLHRYVWNIAWFCERFWFYSDRSLNNPKLRAANYLAGPTEHYYEALLIGSSARYKNGSMSYGPLRGAKFNRLVGNVPRQ